jgi:hypothetical protein
MRRWARALAGSPAWQRDFGGGEERLRRAGGIVKNRGGSYQGKCAIHFLAWHGSGELVDLPGEVGKVKVCTLQ